MAGHAVLLVDDNATNVKLLTYILRRQGFVVMSAGDAGETQALLAARLPDLILMDLQLPDIDGFELTRRIKADLATRHIPVIAVTAFAMKGDEERARAAGCDHYITKPINTAELLAAMARCLPSS